MVFKVTVNQSQATLATQTIPEVVVPKACTYSLYSFYIVLLDCNPVLIVLIWLLKRSVVLLTIQSKILWYDVFGVWSYFISVFSVVLSSGIIYEFFNG